MKKVAMVTTLYPATHYSRYLLTELEKIDNLVIEVWTNKDAQNRDFKFANLEMCWSKGIFYPFQIFIQAFKKKPQIVHLQHEINMYGGKISALIFPFAIVLLKILKIKVIVTMHAVVSRMEINNDFLATFSFPHGNFFQIIIKSFFVFLNKFITFFSDKVIVHSNYLKKSLLRDSRIKESKVNVIPIGVPLSSGEKYDLDKSWVKEICGKKIILYFGYILRRKGLEYLVEAFKKFVISHEDYVLVLAGGELDYQKDYADNLRLRIKQMGLQRKIVFTGFISQEEVMELYRRAMFLVLPYTYSISSSLPLSFAMQYCLPVIASKIGSLQEEISNQKDGILVQTADSTALLEAIQLLVSNNGLYQKLRQGQKEKLLTRGWDNIAQITFSMYNNVSNEI